jgi:hypothetical protein
MLAAFHYITDALFKVAFSCRLDKINGKLKQDSGA